MALSKIIAEGVDLTDDYAFTGTVTGAGEITASTTAPSEGGAATTNVVQGLAKAWLFTTDKTTHVPDNSLNISTMTDNGSGRPEANFTNSFDNTSIAAAGDGGYNRILGSYSSDGGITTSSFAHILVSSSSSISDVASSGVGLGLQYNGDLA